MQHKDLSNSRLSNSNLIGQDLSNSNLRGVDLSKSNLTYANFTGSDLRDISISLSCFSFNHVKFDNSQVKQFLYLLQLAEIDLSIKQHLQNIIGEKDMRRFDKIFGAE